MYTYKYCVCVCLLLCMCVQRHVHTYVCGVCVCVCACVCVCVCVCLCVMASSMLCTYIGIQYLYIPCDLYTVSVSQSFMWSMRLLLLMHTTQPIALELEMFTVPYIYYNTFMHD